MFSFLRPSTGPACPPVSEIVAAMARGEMQLVDVRDTGELRASGKAKGAIHISLGLLALKADPNAPDTMLKMGVPVVLYCASGARSGMAAQMLARMGYGPVWNLGGLGDWIAGGGQVERV
ncbi:sulfurtransferase [Rhodobacter sp. Har01]|uniref:rhodanese-like domain-containing protein n=1 Tax=Rhodobacter sp. Har01 TaxID=2883999 RepID=UPI001D06B8CC|nr:rhodanese-like domain-containing protein [Rhodobacter sp. Har01]MCB6177161.1 sulfurtransferase [Rhodobacter sp. Har01]